MIYLAQSREDQPHILFVRAPDLDKAESQGEGTHPALLEAGRREDVYTFLLVGRDDAGGGNTDTIKIETI